jgi:hypothetical protein
MSAMGDRSLKRDSHGFALYPIDLFVSEHAPNVGEQQRAHCVRLFCFDREQLKRGATRLFWPWTPSSVAAIARSSRQLSAARS